MPVPHFIDEYENGVRTREREIGRPERGESAGGNYANSFLFSSTHFEM